MKLTVITMGTLAWLILGQPLIADQVKGACVLNPHSFIQLAAVENPQYRGGALIFSILNNHVGMLTKIK